MNWKFRTVFSCCYHYDCCVICSLHVFQQSTRRQWRCWEVVWLSSSDVDGRRSWPTRHTSFWRQTVTSTRVTSMWMKTCSNGAVSLTSGNIAVSKVSAVLFVCIPCSVPQTWKIWQCQRRLACHEKLWIFSVVRKSAACHPLCVGNVDTCFQAGCWNAPGCPWSWKSHGKWW